jgi:type III pantothenate kinase
MNLIIDIGNTRVKVALTEEYQIQHTFVWDEIHSDDVTRLLHDHPGIRYVILSSVRKDSPSILEPVAARLEYYHVMNPSTRVPFEVLYTSRETLGNDRLAGVAGASQLFPGKDLLVIDFGTAITYDFMDSKNRYHGGNISPGMKMRFQALHNFTGKLPLVDAGPDVPLLGENTQQAIDAGVQQGILFEVEKYMEKLSDSYPDLKVMATGGDADFFAGKLKNPIFVDQNLVIRGLERILYYHVSNA